MTDPLAHVWAKSAQKGEEAGERLAQHTAHVLANLRARRERYPELGRHGARDDVFDLAAWAVVFHDLGKCARGFQAMVQGGQRFGHRHEVLSLVVVGRLDVDEETRSLVAAGVGTHHKDAPAVRDLYPFGSPDRHELLDDLSRSDELAWDEWLDGDGALKLAKLGFSPLPRRRPVPRGRALGDAMRALQTLTECLAPQPAVSPLALTARAVRGLVVLADHAGSAHQRLGAAPSLDSVGAFLSGAARRLERGLEPHQQEAARTDGHALLVAPTGSGKTEAAFLWAARQRETSAGSPAIFYVLPYRASLNAMRMRIPDYGVPEGSVVLQHSSATSALYGYLLEKPEGYTPGVAAKLARFEQSLAGLMTAPVRVLTPYQLLRAFFGLPGHEAVLTDAAGGLFVLDELHAYDVARLALILVAVRHLAQAAGARVLSMSATFPTVLRDALLSALGGAATHIVATAETQASFVRHRLHVREGDLLGERTLAEIAERFRAGEAVLAVATTVARAQRLFDAARARLGSEGVSLLHGRFAGRDRTEKERQLAKRIGTRERAHSTDGTGTLLVATQVVEVSLDVDFDVLFSDPAPVEALLQRFGRVNRGRRGGLRDVIVHTQHPDEASRVYAVRVIQAALDVLRPHSGSPVHEADVQAWVDAAYAPFERAWRTELADEMARMEEAVVQNNRPLESHPELASLFDELFDGAEVVPRSLADEYERLLDERPLEATGLRVPLSHGQRAMLRKKGLLGRRGTGPAGFDVASVVYDVTRGLDLGEPDNDT